MARKCNQTKKELKQARLAWKEGGPNRAERRASKAKPELVKEKPMAKKLKEKKVKTSEEESKT
jgi:hypothetical protein